MASLKKLTIRHSKPFQSQDGQTIFPVACTHELIQAAGYLKYSAGKSNDEYVYFRGEPNLYDSISPSAFRGKKSHAAESAAVKRINTAIAAFLRPLQSVPAYAHEPLLQHYGLKTTWVDLVDNVWVALWFACHNVKVAGKNNEFIHFERRMPRNDETGKVYIRLVAVDAVSPAKGKPGFFSGEHTECIDLRVAAPSTFVRPHAQHGLLMRMKGDKRKRPIQYTNQSRGLLQINLADALEWLGDSPSLSTHGLFPPPFYDNGYGNLLSVGYDPSKVTGCITHIGA